MAINKGISITILSLAILFMGAQYLTAGEIPSSDEISKEISNNISEEYVTCVAYYSIASEAIRRSGDLKTAVKFEEARNVALQYALIVAKEGRTKEMAENITLARLNLNMKSAPKIITDLKSKSPNSKIVGFKLEETSEQISVKARRFLHKNKLDFVVANTILNINSDKGEFWVIDKNNKIVNIRDDKKNLADSIFDIII